MVNFDGIEVLIRNDRLFGKVSVVDVSTNLQATVRLGAGNEINDHLMTNQWAAKPVHGDEREQPVLDLVPFAGAGWKDMDFNVQTDFLDESTELQFPQA